MTENGPNFDLPLDWAELKQKRAKMDDKECNLCGDSDELYVIFQNNPEEHGYDESNLITTCTHHTPTSMQEGQYRYSGTDPMGMGDTMSVDADADTTGVSSTDDLFGTDDTDKNTGQETNSASDTNPNTNSSQGMEEAVRDGGASQDEVVFTDENGEEIRAKVDESNNTFTLGKTLSNGVVNFFTKHRHEPVSRFGDLAYYQKTSSRTLNFFDPSINDTAEWVGERVWKPMVALIGAVFAGLFLLNGFSGGVDASIIVLTTVGTAMLDLILNPGAIVLSAAVLYTGHLWVRDHIRNIYPMAVEADSLEWGNPETQLWAATIGATVAGGSGWVVLNMGVIGTPAVRDAVWVITHVIYSASVALGVVAIRDAAVQEITVGWGYTTQMWDYPARTSAILAIPGAFVFSGVFGSLVAVFPVAVFAAFMVRSYLLTTSVFNTNCDRDVMPHVRAFEPKCVVKD